MYRVSLLQVPVNLSQYRGSVGIFNNRNFSVQSKVSHFTYLGDNNIDNNNDNNSKNNNNNDDDDNNNNNNNNDDNDNLAIRSFILLNKIGLVLLLLNLMSVFKGNTSRHKQIIFVWTLFPHSFHVTCFVCFISF